MTVALVIGYGNELCSDDGVGPVIARAIAKREYDAVQVIVSHQLTPEMAEEIGRVDRVVFIDARVGNVGVEVQPLFPVLVRAGWGHSSDPCWLLGLTQVLYGRAPLAWLVSVGAEKLSLGSKLSHQVQKDLVDAMDRVAELVLG